MALRHTSNQIHLFISRCQFAAVRGDQYHLLSTQAVSNQYKHLYYQYDLVSGKVNQVDYSPGQRDEYHHRYTYDADNRIVQVETSKDAILWDKDANYEYYKHGPLSRAELGDLKVQGLDYSYTIQGWIKGVNSNTMSAVRDPGRDGDLSLTGNTHAKVATDAFGYTLGYFAGDYNPIGTFTTASKFEASTTGSDLLAARSDLWNGNISHMVTCLPKASDYATNQTITPEAFGSAYKYDQLNRLSSSRVFTNINTTTNQWQSGASTNPTAYATDYTYDAMGNILTQIRNGGGASATALDELTYNYHTTTDGLVSNRLYQVNDVVSAGNYTDDIDDQGTFNNTHSTIETANNYGYDELGNLVRDAQEEIASIEWTVYGKMKKITRNSGSSKADLEFGYDASGNRLWKKVTPKGSGAIISTYYYLRDAQGNEMCRYVKYTNTTSQLMYVAQEHSIYGSSRVGVDNRKDTLYLGAVYTPTWGGVGTSRRDLGSKSFELANHLGNVLVTVSDKPIYKVSSGTIFFQSEITSLSDYYPFGAPMAGRSFSSTEYRFGFNTQEKDDEVNGTGNSLNYKFRMHDTRLGRFFAVDPLTKDYPWYTPYQFSGNKVIHCIELEGLEEWEVNNIDGGKTKTYGPWKDQETAQSQETINEVKTDTRFNFLKVAGNQIGTTETPGSGLNPKITEYHKTGGRYNGTENDAWCASFVNYCLAKGNPEYPRTNSPASNSFYIGATKLQVERVAVPYYGSFMVRSNDGNFNGGQGHVALVVGQVGLGYAQLGGNQAVPGSSSGTTVNVVLREPANNVRYYHYTFLPKVPLSTPLFQTATKVTAKQLGNDR